MKIKFTLLALIAFFTVSAQSFREVQLRKPNRISPLFIGPIFKSTIHYGATPSNYNGKVIVFNHGYIDLNQIQFLFDNSFYEQAYEEGYQTVFVATTRGGGIWKNGRLMAEALDIITDKYNVPDVYIIAHSNGGKAAEAAMISFDKNDKVKKVFALGTPYWGTYIADVSQFPLLRWAWSLTGLNEGARTSTTYYNRDVVRPLLDNDPNNNPGKFVVLGVTGFDRGSNLLARAGFKLTGGIIAPKQGTNDGVSPYSSTLRPGSTSVFSENDPNGRIDHIDVGLGQFTWQYIVPFLTNDQEKSVVKAAPYQLSTRIESDYYLVHSENEYDQIILDKNATYALTTVLHKNENATFQLFPDGNKNSGATRSFTSKNHETTISISNYKNSITSKSPFVAFVRPQNNLRMYFDQEKSGDSPILKAGFFSKSKQHLSLEGVSMRATITKTSTLMGEEIEGSSEVYTFNLSDKEFVFNTHTLSPGVYSILLTGEKENEFKRSILTGFVVGDIASEMAAVFSEQQLHKDPSGFKLIPTIIENEASLSFNNIPGTDLELRIFDIGGKEIVREEVRPSSLSQIDISNTVSHLTPGIYILKVHNFPSVKFIKK